MKILTVIGARPQFIKASVVSQQFQQNGISEIIVHTGQHFDSNMSDIFFEQMKIPRPQYMLNIHSVGHAEMTGRMLIEIEKLLLLEKPDYLLVYGDTNSTLAGALAAKKLHVKVIHVEAGLRSFNMKMPEEVNRILTDRVSDYLFCPTAVAMNNLQREGFSDFDCKIELVGDVMYDSFLHFSKVQAAPLAMNIPHNFVLATIHRAENTDNLVCLKNIITFLNEINQQYPVILPIHPRTRSKLAKLDITIDFTIVDPVGYLEMLWLLNHTVFVVTDSGGLQKEAYFAKKKCLTLRSETEWIELVDHAWNVLYNPIHRLTLKEVDLQIPDSYPLLYGTGQASQLIVDHFKA